MCWTRERYLKRLRAGQCVRCPERAVEGKSMCARCLEVSRVRSTGRRTRNRAAGLCGCGRPRVVSFAKCARCRELDGIKYELECAKKATAALPAWKQEVIRRTRIAEASLG